MKNSFLLFCLLQLPVAGLLAAPSAECITNKYNTYLNAKAAWQRKVTELVIARAPQYKEYSTVYLNDQLRAIELSKRAVVFLAQNAPYKLRTYLPLNNWLNLDQKDARWISAEEPSYARLLDQYKWSRKRAPHPDGDSIRALMQTRIMPSEAYQALLETMLKEVRVAEDMNC